MNKVKILRDHGINAIKLPNGTVLAREHNDEITNITNYTKDELYGWLGYD